MAATPTSASPARPPGDASFRPAPAPVLVWALRVGVLVLGVVVGFCAAWVSRGVWRSATVTVPWGILLAAAGSASGILLARAIRPSLALWAAGGWVVGVVLVLSRGDTIIAGDLLGYGFLLGVTTCVCTAAVWGKGAR